MIEIRKIIKQIEQKQNLDNALSIYSNWLMSASNRYALIRLALNYFTFYETIINKTDLSSDLLCAANKVHQVIQALLTGETKLEQLEEARNHVTASMETITTYTDSFQIFEYVLNRLERRFIEMEDLSIGTEEFTAKLMSFLMKSEDNVIMNGRIQEVVGQLPVRITKGKFYSLVCEALSIYTGSDTSSIENLLYLLRSSAMLQNPESKEGFEHLHRTLVQMQQTDYKVLDPSGYADLINQLLTISAQITDEAGCYLMLQEVINDTYVILLSMDSAIVDAKEQDICKEIIKSINNKFMGGHSQSAEDELTGCLTQLEGKQENLYEKYFEYNHLVSQIWLEKDSYFKNDPMEEKYQILLYIEKLMSSSTFIPLFEPPKESVTADKEYMENITKELLAEFDTVFAKYSKEVNRAIMAKTLSSLPVFFHSAEEINLYIQNSLENCRDTKELETCMELLEELMESENEMV